MSTSPGSGPPLADAEVMRVLLEKRREFEEELVSFEAAASAYIEKINRSLKFFKEAIRRAHDVSTDVHELRNSRPQTLLESSISGHGVFDSTADIAEGDTAKAAGNRPGSRYGDNQTRKVLDMMGKLIDEFHQPISKRLLMERLEASGYELTVSDPKKFVQKALWRSKEFEYLEAQDGWWRAGVPLPG